MDNEHDAYIRNSNETSAFAIMLGGIILGGLGYYLYKNYTQNQQSITTSTSTTTATATTTTIIENAILKVTPTQVLTNGVLNFSGSGFSSNASVTIYANNGWNYTTNAGLFGNFGNITPVTIPVSDITQTAGTLSFYAIDNKTGYQTPSVSVTVVQATQTTSPQTTSVENGYLIINPTSVSITGSINVSGKGFSPNASVTIYTNTGYNKTVNTGLLGNFGNIIPITIPASAFSNPAPMSDQIVTFYAIDNKTGYRSPSVQIDVYNNSVSTTTTTTTTTTITAGSSLGTLSASPTTVYLGSTVTFNVSGLTPNSQYILYAIPLEILPYDIATLVSNPSLIQQVLAGTQAIQFTMPHQLSSSGSATLPYVVTSISPLWSLISKYQAIFVIAKDSTGRFTNPIILKG